MHCVLYIALFSVSCQAFCHWFRLTSSPSTPPYPNTHRLSELISWMSLMWNTGYELQGHGAPFHCPTVSTAARTAKERLFFGLFYASVTSSPHHSPAFTPLLWVTCVHRVYNRAKRGILPLSWKGSVDGAFKGPSWAEGFQLNILAVLTMPLCKCFGFSKLCFTGMKTVELHRNSRVKS